MNLKYKLLVHTYNPNNKFKNKLDTFSHYDCPHTKYNYGKKDGEGCFAHRILYSTLSKEVKKQYNAIWFESQTKFVKENENALTILDQEHFNAVMNLICERPEWLEEKDSDKIIFADIDKLNLTYEFAKSSPTFYQVPTFRPDNIGGLSKWFSSSLEDMKKIHSEILKSHEATSKAYDANLYDMWGTTEEAQHNFEPNSTNLQRGTANRGNMDDTGLSDNYTPVLLAAAAETLSTAF